MNEFSQNLDDPKKSRQRFPSFGDKKYLKTFDIMEKQITIEIQLASILRSFLRNFKQKSRWICEETILSCFNGDALFSFFNR